MPLFTSAPGFQINGGSFIDNAGDINIHTSAPRPDNDPLSALEFASGEGLGRRLPGNLHTTRQLMERDCDPLPAFESVARSRHLPGVDRVGSQAGIARMLPCNASHRPHASGGSHAADRLPSSMVSSASLPPFSAFLASTFSRPHPDVSRPQPPSNGNRAIEYRTAHELGNRSVPDQHLPPGHQIPLDSEIATRYPSFPRDHPQVHQTSLNGRTFIGGNVNHIQPHGEPGLNILYRAAAGDATHDSEDRFPQPRCHPKTRTKMLDALWDWTCGIEPKKDWNWENCEWEYTSSSSDNNSHPILWLHGPTGAGKSAIAQSLCQRLEGEGRLGASFFFKRGHPSRGHVKWLFATIAYQLSLVLPTFNHQISQTLERNPSLVDKSISIQLQKLIVEPFEHTTSTCPLVVVIDGLDECEDQSSQQEILCSIGHVFHEHQLPLQFLIASRPDPHIQEIFTDALNRIHCPVNIDQSFADVRKYLLDEFARIHHEHCATMSRVPAPWPSPEIIDHLVRKSSGYFIYASTIIKFIDDKNFRPTEHLEVIVGFKESDFESPFAPLDQLYTQILSEAPARAQVLKILAVIAAKLSLSADHIDQLLELEPGDVRLALHGLHSVIKFPEQEEKHYASLSIHHASFSDFLQDSSRTGEFYVSSGQHRSDLSHSILKAFSCKNDDASLNQSHVAWYLNENAFEYIISSELSSDLVCLLRSLNPDFLFTLDDCSNIAVKVLDWLKRSQSLPEDLVHLWEDYCFMSHCQYILRTTEFNGIQVTEKDWDHYHWMLSQASPSLIRILRAIPFVHEGTSSIFYLFSVCIQLNVSWEELRTALHFLCSLKDQDEGEEFIMKVLIVAFDHALSPWSFDSMMWDLACGALHAMLQMVQGEMDKEILHLMGWGCFLRSCPPSPKLLQDLQETESIWASTYGEIDLISDYHNIIQWLKMFPKPLQELISRVEGYLERKRGITVYNGDYEERRWKEDNPHMRYHDLKAARFGARVL
ncbi:hypothetical protein B0H19DRAFT_1236482 [Mycena capillaripes]|nr:hypothetical protein B0H19DRAFT_1236482 [Mycena capillaripes]